MKPLALASVMTDRWRDDLRLAICSRELLRLARVRPFARVMMMMSSPTPALWFAHAESARSPSKMFSSDARSFLRVRCARILTFETEISRSPAISVSV